MINGVVSVEDIFLYTPEDTIPKKDLSRFLEQCDNMIILLDPRTINKAEVEEIAKVYRESIVSDDVYRTLAEEGATLDPTIISSLEKILKTIERRKENLAIRASDRDKARDFNKDVTMIDILTQVAADANLLEREEKELNLKIEEQTKELTKTEDFMEERPSTNEYFNQGK